MTEGCDPSRVVATGPGLQQALTDKTNNFKIVTRCCSHRDVEVKPGMPEHLGIPVFVIMVLI